ncbi:Cell cycle response regulator CtrA [Saliniradius amylolyticus]|uniref:Cell cycle response regulator CtrA n=1 Tax=Saliniradius amylolyticus TaxID=2183582 RepID=A0A2S2E542_9ALTE|nr:response regulator [Saliniradius amylolyticus]AWL12753.1 Cell cycle response regulator CtrA [Saliniradius amylolyticus]
MFSVLICDDSLVARKQVAKCLPTDWDVSVHFAKHGEEAIEALKEGKGQLLLLDLNMPVMDGYQVLETIQQQRLNTQVIVISGDVQPEAHQRVKNLGALAFIEKPIKPELFLELLSKHDLFRQHSEAAAPELTDIDPKMRDAYQEITNIAMGQAGDHLARILNVFVELPIPNVNLIEAAELQMMLQNIEDKESVSGTCQGFVGPGISGEALFILSESSFSDVAKILNIQGAVDDRLQLELLMDAANILIGTCLNGLANQLDMHFSQGHPVVLGQHRNISELISVNKTRWRRTLAIELSYGLEGYDAHCELILLFSENSLPVLNNKLAHLVEDA